MPEVRQREEIRVMGHPSDIAWCDATRNLVYGYTKVDVDPLTGACRFCYIDRALPRYGYDPEKISFLSLDNAVKEFRKWSKDPSIKKIFLNNYSDTFHEDIPFKTIETWHREVIEAFPNFEFQLLTKRIGRAMMFYKTRPVPGNVWMGCTIGAPDKLWRLKQLKQINAKVRWLSCEPLLGDLVYGNPEMALDLHGIHWLVVGGESGSTPRPMSLQWAVNIAEACKTQKVAYFFKQRGGPIARDGAGGNVCPCCNQKHQEFPKY